MAKKKCWFGWLRKIFVSEDKPKAEKKSKGFKWVLRKLKFRQCRALPGPRRTINEATEKHRKYALTVALATAAAAEAAVAAAEVVRLTSSSSHSRNHCFINGDESLAAVKIQSAFRAYLARKALRALKALVRLQAVVRGRAVRRKTNIKLKHLPSNVKTRSDVQAKSIGTLAKLGEYKHITKSNDSEEKESEGKNHRKDGQLIQTFGCNSRTNWDYSTVSKEDMKAQLIRKHDANIRRDRMLKYSFSQQERRNTRMFGELLMSKGSGRYSNWPEHWEDKKACRGNWTEKLKPVAIYDRFSGDASNAALVTTKSTRKQDSVDGLNSLALSFPRRSLGQARWSTSADGGSAPNSPAFPPYMAATLSAKAKARSMSVPKQQVAFCDSWFDRSCSYKNDPYFCSSYNGESFGAKVKNTGASQPMSTSLNRHF